MGHLFTRLFDRIAGEARGSKILLLGLDGAGKTTLVMKLKLGEVVHTVPTIGFNVETVEYKRLRFTMWDIGGQDKIRVLWRYYFSGSDAIVFLVDVTDSRRLALAKAEIHKLLEDDELQDAALLVLANKMDTGVNVSVPDIKDKLDLDTIKGRPWAIYGCSALTGAGVFEGFDWLTKQLTKK